MRAVVGLGANLGDRLGTMRAALRELSNATHVTAIVATSRVYETEPVGPEQPPFLNAAALLVWEGTPAELLDELLGVEARLGRVRRERWGPRTIDLDLLWADGLVVDVPELAVPHPRLRERAFALQPLLDVVPDACDPRTGEPYARVLAALVVEPRAVRPTAERL